MEAEAIAVAAEAAVAGDLHGGRLEAHLVTLPNPLAVPDHQVLIQVIEDKPSGTSFGSGLSSSGLGTRNSFGSTGSNFNSGFGKSNTILDEVLLFRTPEVHDLLSGKQQELENSVQELDYWVAKLLERNLDSA